MGDTYYYFLIHHRLLDGLRSADASLRSLVQKTLERLQCGEWKNGTRVKRLRGVASPVFEARIDRARRMLFTITRAPAAQPPFETVSFALIWDVVEHDAVSRRAKRLNSEPEAGFLDFLVLEEAELVEPPKNAAVALSDDDSLDAAMDRLSEFPAEKSAEIIEPIKWFSLDAEDLVDESCWQELMDAGRADELELKLTREQATTAMLPGPVLLRGAAGSGKTTVSIYRLAAIAENWHDARILYVTYNRSLLKTARQQFSDICTVRRVAERAEPDFLTFPAFCQLLIGDVGGGQPQVRFSQFRIWYQALYGREDAALAWEEIRGIVKGACLEADQAHLTQGQYEALGRKRAPLFRGERERLFRVFERYQAWCNGFGRVDDVDLARAARSRGGRTWDFVICDEGQDLTEIEVALLLDVCARPDGLFFAADPQQIVNPSGFRWAELRTLMRRRLPGRAAPEIVGLSRNFRSVAPIVATANAIVRMQRARTGRTDDDHFQESALRGSAPLVVGGDGDLALENLRGFGPRCAVIVADDQTGERLQLALGSERIFPVSEAKGLEFDGCVLWDMISGDFELWEELINGSAEMKEDPAARRALRHLYVAVTRSRRYLGMYESDPRAEALWQEGVFRGMVEADVPEALAKFMLSSHCPADWVEEGDWFLDRERYRQAAECYRQAGESDKETAARAADRQSVGEFESAADLFESISSWKSAAICREHAGGLDRAAELFAQADCFDRVAECRQSLGQWALAADAWEKVGGTLESQKCRLQDCLKRRDWPGAAALSVILEEPRQAIVYFRRAGMRKQVKELQLNQAIEQGDFEAQAAFFEQEGHWAEAAVAWESAQMLLEASRCLAEAAEAACDYEIAGSHWRKAGDPFRSDRCGALALEAAEDFLDAARVWHLSEAFADRDRVLALAKGGRADRWRQAIVAERAGEISKAIILYDETELYAEGAGVLDWFARASSAAVRSRHGISGAQRDGLLAELPKLEAYWRCRWHVSAIGSDARESAVEALTANGLEAKSCLLLGEVAAAEGDWVASVAYYYHSTEQVRAADIMANKSVTNKDLSCRARAAADRESWLIASRFSAAAGQKRRPYEFRAKYFESKGMHAEAADEWALAGFNRKADASRAKVLP